jgi:hypothetical protein
MARYPGAIWKPLNPQYVPHNDDGPLRIASYNRLDLHVAVSEALSLYPFFNYPGRASSHFYIRKDGTVEQYIDTAFRAEADYEGNDATISVETQGGLHGPNTEPWTDAQVKALAKLFAWLVKTHGIPARLATDSKIGDSSHGLSWHRLGIDGNFPALPSILAGRKQRGGGMHYSTSAGKLCPGDAKIKQVPLILAEAKEILAPPAPKPAPTPAPSAPEVVPVPVSKEKNVHVIRRGVALPAKGQPAPKYSLVTGDRAVAISVTAAKQYKAAGVPVVGLPGADYDVIVKALTA